MAREEIENTLVEAVIDEIMSQLEGGDLTALDELLRFLPRENLIGFLPDNQSARFR